MNNVAVVHDCVLHVLLHCLSCNCHAVAVELGKELLQEGRHAACQAEVVNGILGAAGCDMGKKRYVVGCLVEILPPGLVIAGFVGDGGNMEKQIGGCRYGHIHLDCIADRLGGDYLTGCEAFFHHSHDPLSSLVCY